MKRFKLFLKYSANGLRSVYFGGLGFLGAVAFDPRGLGMVLSDGTILVGYEVPAFIRREVRK